MTRLQTEQRAQELTSKIKGNRMLHYYTAEPVDGKWVIMEHRSKQEPRIYVE